jgi:hypothetical protein
MKPVLILLFFLVIPCLLISQNIVTTNDGKKIIFFDDGTWKYMNQIEISIEPTVLAVPPFKEKPAVSSNGFKPVKLTDITPAGNMITDNEEWFIKNGIKLPSYTVPNSFIGVKGNCPDPTPASYKGKMLVRAIYSDLYNCLIYGNSYSEGNILVITDKEMKNVLYVLDFSNYQNTPKDISSEKRFITQSINWAVLENNVLYVSTGHQTYAASSGGLNAFISAIDIKTDSLLWMSRPLVCNSVNFELTGDAIISGYGFTAEPDFLFVINKYTGAVTEKVPIKTGPSFILKKEDKLFVRTYDKDYVFQVK